MFGINKRRRSSREVRAIMPWNVYGDADAGMKTNSGTSITERTSFNFNVVYAAITLIADGVAGLPPAAFVEKDDGTLDPGTLPQWIRRPHRELRRFDVFHQLLIALLAWGNGYARFVRRPSDGVIVGLDVLDPSDVECEWDPAPERSGTRRYRIDGAGPWLTVREIFHVQGPTFPGEPKGMSPIRAAREAIAFGLTLEEFGARYFSNGSQAKVVIELPGQKIVKDEEARQIVKTFERFHRGKGNWHRPALMTGGAKLHNVSIPPEDAQFLQSRDFQAMTVASWFRVPPHRVGIVGKSTSWGSGLAEENQAMLQYTFRPWIKRFEGALTQYAPGGEDMGTLIKLLDDDLQRGTFKEMAETWTDLVDKGIATPDEARKKLGLKALGGDADKLRDPAKAGDGGAGPRSKEDDRLRKQEEAAGRSDLGDGDLFTRHMPGKHDQSTHGSGRIGAGTRFDELSPKGQQAVLAAEQKLGVSKEAMAGEIESKLTSQNIADGKAWFPQAREFNEDLANRSGLSVEQCTAITSAVSPQTPWPRNKVLAERVAMKWRDYDGLSAKDAAKKMGGGLSANLAAGIEIARGGSIDKHLTGVKRRSFYNNMLDPEGSTDVTIDTWMGRIAMNTSTKAGGVTLEDAHEFIKASKASTNGGAGYVSISEAVHLVSEKTGLLPSEVQSAYWIAVSGSIEGQWGRE